VVAACGGSDSDPDVTLAGAIARACTATVSPSADDQTTVQAMFVEADDGDTLCFSPGTYELTDPLDLRGLKGITIKGTGASQTEVVLDFSAQTSGAKGLNLVSMENLVVSNLSILDATGDNLFIESSTNVSIHKVRSGWVSRPIDARGRYALYPVSSTNVLVDQSEAFGSSDAGIYVGQVTNCVVRDSIAHDNVTGIEIENSTNCEVKGNTAEDNTGGLLVFELPGLPTRGAGTWVHDNIIRDNNTPSFAEEGSFVSYVPAGTGVMLLASNDVLLENNTITGNLSTGVFVVSYPTVVLVGGPASADPNYEQFTDRAFLKNNTFGNNGTMPAGSLMAVLGLAGLEELEDVVWDGSKYGVSTMISAVLCMQGAGTFININIPGDFETSTDRTPHECTQPSRSAVVLPQDAAQ
jgi:parallel beta-helix repeat protein